LSQLQRVKIGALGTFVPPRLLTNADLEKLVDTNDQWIMERVGIRQRHIVDKGLRPAIWRSKPRRKRLPSAESRPPISMPLSWDGYARHVFSLDRLFGAA